MKSFAFAAALLPFTLMAHAAEDAIDQQHRSCLDNASTTAQMEECGRYAYSQWDEQLDARYAALMSALSADQQRVLQASQRAWLAFRDAEFDTQTAVYSTLQGTLYQAMRWNDRIALVRDRTVQLKSYQALLSGSD
jgi:uncharacterized protein YecT (DUF1311 family)